MATVDAVCVVRDCTLSTCNGTNTTLVLSVGFVRTDGLPGQDADVPVTLGIGATAGQWKQAFPTAVKNLAAAPPGSADTFNLIRLYGFVDITTVVP